MKTQEVYPGVSKSQMFLSPLRKRKTLVVNIFMSKTLSEKSTFPDLIDNLEGNTLSEALRTILKEQSDTSKFNHFFIKQDANPKCGSQVSRFKGHFHYQSLIQRGVFSQSDVHCRTQGDKDNGYLRKAGVEVKGATNEWGYRIPEVKPTQVLSLVES